MCACMCQSQYVQLKPHVFATPVIDDFDADSVTEELVIPVTYYSDDDR